MKYIALIVISIFFFQFSAEGQRANLPLSSVGLGEVRSPVHASQLGMGGVNSSFYNANIYNVYNPASLAYLRNTSLGISVFGRSNTYENTATSEVQWDGGIDYVHIAFPLQNIFNESFKEEKSTFRMGAALSLQPYSKTSYSISSRFESEALPNYSSLSEGEGETYTANLSFGIGRKNFAIGFDAGLFFGSNEFSNLILFDDRSINISIVEDQIGYQGFHYKLGALYEFTLNENLMKNNSTVTKKSITLGAGFSGARNVRTNTDHLELSLPVTGVLSDTLDFSGGIKDDIQLPMSFNVGLNYRNGKQWMIGVDYEMSQWSSVEGFRLDLNDAYRLSAGAEYVPNRNSFNSYLGKVRYRGGVFMGRDYRTLNGENWDTRGFNLGIGLPIALPRQKTTFVDLAFEWGDYDIQLEGVEDRYYRISLGLTINDNTWFFKQKYQ